MSLDFKSYMSGALIASFGIAAVNAYFSSNSINIRGVQNKENVTACELYKEFAKKADRFITKDGTHSIVEIKGKNGDILCKLQHSPKPEINVPVIQ